ncbi:MAG: serine/threonine-protein kinase [Nannocystaceae bacterium]|nr:serine/threonine-protein kinase [Nannocystaceae bacterium]
MSMDAPTSPMATTEPGSAAAAELRAGSVVGRYVVTGTLGSGGAGSVFAAYDPELDRRVAVKLLHQAEVTGDDAALRRLMHEARALAKLNHPNVVVVHDVGVDAGRGFLATELVDGTDLRQWLGQRPTLDLGEIVHVFEGAGRGLAAAHAAGLVHGDFKPANVLVGKDGRPRVADFGLARLQRRTLAPSTDDGEPARVDELVGTPYYMAPEQFEGAQPDAAADQYAFCLSLLEAATRRRVYEPTSITGLMVVKQEPLPDASLEGLPPWLRSIVARGLARAPQSRHATMDALLDAIAQTQRRRRRVVAGAWVLGASALGGATTLAVVGNAPVPCADARAEIDVQWNAERREELQRAFASAHRWGGDIGARVGAGLDEYAAALADGRAKACLAEHHRVQPPALLQRRQACLADRLDHLVAQLEVFSEPDVDTVLQADAAVRALPSVEPCADPGSLRQPADPEQPKAAAALEQQLRRVDAALRVNGFDRARTLLQEAAVSATAIGDAALQRELEVRRGTFLVDTGEFAEAIAVLEPTVLAAFAAGQDETALRGLGPLVRTLGAVELAFADAQGWARWGEPLAARSGAAPAMRAKTLQAIASSQAAAGELAAAIATMQRARSILIDADAPAIEVALVELRLGELLSTVGELEQAQSVIEGARAVIDATVGPTHPDAAAATGILGVVLGRRGDPRGYALVQQAVEDLRQAYGPDHPALAPALGNVAALAIDRGDFVTARRALNESYALQVRRFGPDHLVLGPTLLKLATASLWSNDAKTGLDELERAERIFLAAGPNHPDLWRVYRQKAYALAELGRIPEALDTGRRAVEALDRVPSPRASDRGDARLQLAWVQTLTGDNAGARVTYDAGIELVERSAAAGDRQAREILIALLTARAELAQSQGDANAAAADRERIAALGR